MTTEAEHIQFIKELKDLLTKYNASIELVLDESSDTHGIHGEHMCVSYRTHPKEFRFETKKLADGFGVDANDL